MQRIWNSYRLLVGMLNGAATLENSLAGSSAKNITAMCVHAKSLQPCSTLCNPVDQSLPGFSVHGDSPGKNTGVGCHALLIGILMQK